MRFASRDVPTRTIFRGPVDKRRYSDFLDLQKGGGRWLGTVAAIEAPKIPHERLKLLAGPLSTTAG